jgi:lipopolysaccharide/colanic/teichoic acid biosynthesis glycosyltransferase
VTALEAASATPEGPVPASPVPGTTVPETWRDTSLRRAVDVVLASAGLVAVAPAMGAIAWAVRRDSPGPAVFRQTRVGAAGKDFQIMKFRTMVVDADRAGPAVSGNADPRVTRVGALLRKSKLDELPQLVNVLRGDMTLIGPRAEVPQYVAHYSEQERATLLVRPGLTGPGGLWFTRSQAAQLDESEDPERAYVEWQLPEKLALDIEYLRNRTLLTDLRILAETVGVLFKRD